MSVVVPHTTARTMDELFHQLGDVPASRVRVFPRPGWATVQDVIDLNDHEDRLCELVDGTLVEKPVGIRESVIAGAIVAILRAFVVPRNLGIVTSEAGMMQLIPGLVRIPDAAFIAWANVSDGKLPQEPVPLLAPDLVVEVLSSSNTVREMQRKRTEYFDAGAKIVWMVDLRTRSVDVYTSPDQVTTFAESDTLTGGDVLPGFELSLKTLFAELDRQA